MNASQDNSQDSIYELMRKQGLWTSEQLKNFKQSDIDVLMSGKRTIEQQAIIHNNGSISYFPDFGKNFKKLI